VQTLGDAGLWAKQNAYLTCVALRDIRNTKVHAR
jgi:hypothetical protein